MANDFGENTSVYISNKTKLNLMFNLCQCGRNLISSSGRIHVKANGMFTFACINSGLALLECEKSVYKIDWESGFIAFPDKNYAITNIGTEDVSLTWVSFTGFSVEQYLNRANIYIEKPVYQDCNHEIHNRLNQIFQLSKTFPNRYCPMMSVMYDTFRVLLDANPTRLNEKLIDNTDFIAADAVNFIEYHYAKNISVEQIAAAVGVSQKVLYTFFNRTMNISPKQYLIYYRIDKACSRLKSTSQSIQEISETVGYTNQFYFAKEFKRITGMTPSQFRKNPETQELLTYKTFMSKFSLPQQEMSSTDLAIEEPVVSVYLATDQGD